MNKQFLTIAESDILGNAYSYIEIEVKPGKQATVSCEPSGEYSK